MPQKATFKNRAHGQMFKKEKNKRRKKIGAIFKNKKYDGESVKEKIKVACFSKPSL